MYISVLFYLICYNFEKILKIFTWFVNLKNIENFNVTIGNRILYEI